MLKASDIKGIMSYVPTVFTDSGSLDKDRNRENFRRLIDVGMHGIQILGSSAEFFSVTLEEHETLAKILAEEVEKAKSRVITICGCGGQGLADATARTKIARDCGMDASMLVLPYYFPVNAEAARIYLERIAEAVPDIALVHYNSVNTKSILRGKDYAAMRHIPSLIGAKQPGKSGPAWRDLTEHSGHLNHFGCDDDFLYTFMNGATACDLLISAMRPRLALALYKACVARDWEVALQLQRTIWDIMLDVNYGYVEEMGYADPTGDKALVEASRFLHGGAVRAPYVPFTPEHLAELTRRMDKYPDVECL